MNRKNHPPEPPPSSSTVHSSKPSLGIADAGLIRQIQDLLRQPENRGIQRTMARSLAISDAAISKAISRGNGHVITLAADLITRRAQRSVRQAMTIQRQVRRALNVTGTV